MENELKPGGAKGYMGSRERVRKQWQNHCPRGTLPITKMCHRPGNIMKDRSGEITSGLKEEFHTKLS